MYDTYSQRQEHADIIRQEYLNLPRVVSMDVSDDSESHIENDWTIV